MVLFLPLQKRFKLRLVPRHTGCLIAANQLQHMTVDIRNDLLEIREPLVKVFEDCAALFRAAKRDMTPQKFAETGNVLLLRNPLNGDKLLVDTQIELMLRIQHIGDAARIPAAKFRPVWPSTTTVPPVIYSQPWSPTPSTTTSAPELRTQNRSPAMPEIKALPLVAP